MNNLYRLALGSYLLFVFIGVDRVRAENMSETEVVILPPVIVTATKTEISRDESAASATVIDAKTIEEKQLRTVVDALRTVPGLDIVQTGGPGGTASVFIRGGNSSHTLVLIDGVQVNSPTLGQYNFANLTTDNVERIEIIRGPQSTLYGADAVGGVIQIFTKTGRGPFSGSFSVEGGSFNSYRESLNLMGSSEQIDYSFSASRFDTKGFSKAEAGSERDGYENTSLSSRIALHLTETALLDWSMRYSDARVDVDGFSNTAPFNPIDNFATQENTSFSSAVSFSSQILDAWRQNFQYFFQDEESTGKDIVPGFNNFKIETQNQTFDWQHDLSLGQYNTLTLGYEYEALSGKNNGTPGFDKTLRNKAPYALNQFRFAPVIFNVGFRLDDNSQFGEKKTYKTELAYLHDATNSKIRATYGTGFHAPTLNDLYFPNFGNPNLKPEESRSFEFGFEQKLMGDALQLTATYFHTRFDELIVFVFDPNTFIGQPENVQKAKIEGWELGGVWRISKKITLSLDYTLTDTQNKNTGDELARRPKHKGSGTLTLKPIQALSVSLDFRYVGKRFNDTANNIRMNDYTVVNLATRYDFTKTLQGFARIENLLNRDYQEVNGFATAGFSGFGGMQVSF
ncbi:Outer membrane vitamin B12 receptor BtuB [hydrothermal vent metagenome]|uniref:Outer membrane vitamin B12 receptor BtuB n=1 Tax=hydrothermal vent metagenome TaxID=652676 RepID=A0A3B1CHW2_9ZZZZ